MNVEIGTESAQFLEKEHMYGIFRYSVDHKMWKSP
jgi:hypothetical protein